MRFRIDNVDTAPHHPDSLQFIFDGAFVGMHGFGASAPAKDLYKHFGITAEAAVNAALKRLG